MAQKIEIQLIDDMDGSEAVETVRFRREGRDYEIDLSMANATRLRKGLAQFVASARHVNGARRPTAPASRRTAADREQAAVVRDWARSNGFHVSGRGRLSAEILTAYQQRS